MVKEMERVGFGSGFAEDGLRLDQLDAWVNPSPNDACPGLVSA